MKRIEGLDLQKYYNSNIQVRNKKENIDYIIQYNLDI